MKEVTLRFIAKRSFNCQPARKVSQLVKRPENKNIHFLVTPKKNHQLRLKKYRNSFTCHKRRLAYKCSGTKVLIEDCTWNNSKIYLFRKFRKNYTDKKYAPFPDFPSYVISRHRQPKCFSRFARTTPVATLENRRNRLKKTLWRTFRLIGVFQFYSISPNCHFCPEVNAGVTNEDIRKSIEIIENISNNE